MGSNKTERHEIAGQRGPGIRYMSWDGQRKTGRSFRSIVPGPPRGHSYARQIAARYGLSFEQIDDLLRSRGIGDGTFSDVRNGDE
ncbi:MAG: hypothetical protein Kow00106_17450 [Anaerolineae bacterium]